MPNLLKKHVFLKIKIQIQSIWFWTSKQIIGYHNKIIGLK